MASFLTFIAWVFLVSFLVLLVYIEVYKTKSRLYQYHVKKKNSLAFEIIPPIVIIVFVMMAAFGELTNLKMMIFVFLEVIVAYLWTVGRLDYFWYKEQLKTIRQPNLRAEDSGRL